MTSWLRSRGKYENRCSVPARIHCGLAPGDPVPRSARDGAAAGLSDRSRVYGSNLGNESRRPGLDGSGMPDAAVSRSSWCGPRTGSPDPSGTSSRCWTSSTASASSSSASARASIPATRSGGLSSSSSGRSQNWSAISSSNGYGRDAPRQVGGQAHRPAPARDRPGCRPPRPQPGRQPDQHRKDSPGLTRYGQSAAQTGEGRRTCIYRGAARHPLTR